jgi:hypothetical protein
LGPQSDILFTPGPGESLQLWSLPDLREVRRAELKGLGSEGFVRGLQRPSKAFNFTIDKGRSGPYIDVRGSS